jgi:hypothetical protein
MNGDRKTIVSEVIVEYNHLIKNLAKGKAASLICHIGGCEIKVRGMGKLTDDSFYITSLDEAGNEFRLFVHMHSVYFRITLFDSDKPSSPVGFAEARSDQEIKKI